MRVLAECCLMGLTLVTLGQPQGRSPGAGRMPDGQLATATAPKSEQQVLQSAHEQNLEDTSRLVKLSTELKWDLANHDREVLSVATLKKMDEIERLVRKIRSRVTSK